MNRVDHHPAVQKLLARTAPDGLGDYARPPVAAPPAPVYASPRLWVKVKVDGGSAGDAATQCSFTYTVYDLDGATILKKNSGGDAATGMSPVMPRPSLGILVSPPDFSYGEAFWDGSSLILWDAGETYSALNDGA